MVENEAVELLENVEAYKKIYEIVRLVDPVRKEVIGYKNNVLESMQIRCFDFWEKDTACKNCISFRAYHENKTYLKVENSSNKSYLVMAIPYELSDRRVVIELLKDISESMFLESEDTVLKSNLLSVIDQLNSLILKDALTEIYNRRYIIEKLPVDIINASLLMQPISIIMFDLDFLKKINDTYGHQAGDIVIKGSANCALSCLERKTDWVARYGGEEFIVTLPGAELNKAIEIAEEIRKRIEKEDFQYNDEHIQVTASFGICNIIPEPKTTMEEVIEKADKNLYKAKKNGRNKIEY